MIIKKMKLSELSPADYNPRKMDKDSRAGLKASMDRWGCVEPIVFNDRSKKIVGGHQRYDILKEQGVDETDVVVIDIPESEEKALNVALNNPHITGEFTDELQPLLDEIKVSIGEDEFKELMLDELVVEIDEPEDGLTDPDAVPEDVETICKLGDLWTLGDHRLLCGDATKAEDVGRLMGDGIDLIFTSPPYNAGDNALGGNKNRTASKYANDTDDKSQDEYLDFLYDSVSLSLSHSKYTIVNIQMLAGNKIALINFLYKFRDHLADIAVWHKGFGQPAAAHNVMNSRFEFLLIFSKDKFPNRAISTGRFHGTVPNIYEASSGGDKEFSSVHAATFPVHLPEWIIENFTTKNNSVGDIFGGSGSTLIACERLNRKCYMMEIDPHYCDVIIKRWEDFTGNKATKID